MRNWASRWIWAVLGWSLVGMGTVSGPIACDSRHAVPGSAVPEVSSTTSTAQTATVNNSKTPDAPALLNQSFAEATRSDPPSNWHRPPDVTITGKSVGKLYTEVVGLWESIRFVTESGKRMTYVATLETELGPIQITFLPEVAPNHVRNFVALAKVGFYDGLVFQRTIHEKPEDQPELELIEAGCPLGTGEIGHGSIGYWLKPEFNTEAHIEGTVGACHGEEVDTAGCKFYITLTKAPYLDKNFTVFGRVTGGLDVARRIAALPVRNDAEFPEGDRPEKPVVIRRVVIQPSEVAN